MNYRVVYSRELCSAIADHVDYLRAQQVASDIIERWYDRLFARMDNLGMWPRSCPVDEHESDETGYEIRKLVYARHIITYRVDDVRKQVLLQAMVHGARRK